MKYGGSDDDDEDSDDSRMSTIAHVLAGWNFPFLCFGGLLGVFIGIGSYFLSCRILENKGVTVLTSLFSLSIGFLGIAAHTIVWNVANYYGLFE